MALVKTSDKKSRRFQDAKGMFVTRYDENGNLEDTTYDIHDIVGDTLSLTQDDADRTEIPWEFGDDPLDENTKMGAKHFTCQCLDFQDDIMKTLFGCTIVNGAVVFPSEYKDLYVMIRVVFDDCDFVLPYVKMDAKATLENLRSDIARGELSGTLYSKEVLVDALPTESGQGSGTYTAENAETTPMLYVPNSGDNPRAVYVKKVSGELISWITDYRDIEPAPTPTPTQYAISWSVTPDSTGSIAATVDGEAVTAGNFDEGTEIVLTATAETGYEFSKWEDDSTTNPRTITVSADATYTATFVEE